jgi:cell division protein FtsW
MKALNNIKSDRTVWIIVLLISIFSLLVVYSSSNVLAHRFKGGNTEVFLFKQFVVICLGFGIMVAMQFFNYKYFSRISQIGFLFVLPLLVLTLIIGKSEGGAERWLELFGISIQTSEIAKLVLIIYVARVLTVKQDQLGDFMVVLKYLLLPIIAVCILILPSNFSTAAMLFVICFVMMFLGRVKTWIMAVIAGAGIVFILLFGIWIWNWPKTIPGGRGETWKARVAHFIGVNPDADQALNHLIKNSDENYQADMAKIAVANGKIFGVGPGNSIQRNFLPQANSDFIFAIYIEEYGLIFAVGLIFLYMILFFRGIAILKKSDKTFGGLMVVGLSFAIIFQAFINMAVAVGLFPVTGQPLPMFSSGGTSILFTLVALGIILSVSRWSLLEKEGKGGAVEAT